MVAVVNAASPHIMYGLTKLDLSTLEPFKEPPSKQRVAYAFDQAGWTEHQVTHMRVHVHVRTYQGTTAIAYAHATVHMHAPAWKSHASLQQGPRLCALFEHQQ